jgi:hypothetical protein
VEPSRSAQIGASYGDQTTGGQISFGFPNNPDRALGLLATASTGFTAFGAKFINGTGTTLRYINLQFTGELWRQSNLPKTLECYYFIDPTAANFFATNRTASVPSLNVSFPTVASAVGGIAVDGTASSNQTQLAVLNQMITDWPSGAALWLVWEMADSTGKAQGLAIDHLRFSASNQPLSAPPPSLAAKVAGDNLILSWPSILGQTCQLESTDDLAAGQWTPLGDAFPGTGAPVVRTNSLNGFTRRFFRLRILP